MWQDITANHLRVEQIGANIYSSVTTWPTVYLRATKIHMTETRMEKKNQLIFLYLKCVTSVWPFWSLIYFLFVFVQFYCCLVAKLCLIFLQPCEL